MIVICTGQYKAAHYQKISTTHFLMTYQSCFSDSYFSRYNDSLSARFFNTLYVCVVLPGTCIDAYSSRSLARCDRIAAAMSTAAINSKSEVSYVAAQGTGSIAFRF